MKPDVEPHGSYRVSRLGQLMCVRARDQWNLEAAQSFVAAFRTEAAPLEHSRWAVITDLRDWQLGVPEMEPVMSALDLWCLRAGQKMEVTIVPESPAVRWQVEQMFASTENLIKRHFCERPDQACEWIAEQGLVIDISAALALFAERWPDSDD